MATGFYLVLTELPLLTTIYCLLTTNDRLLTELPTIDCRLTTTTIELPLLNCRQLTELPTTDYRLLIADY